MSVAKALFLGLPLHGHTNPSLPLVRALVDRGEEVVYWSTDAFASKIEQTGARYRRYQNAFLADLTQLPERTDELSWLLMRTTGEVLAQDLDAFRAERPTYVIADSVAPWGQWVAQVLGIPVVTSVTTFAFNRRVLAFGVARGTRPRSARVLLSKIRHLAKAARLGRRLRRQYRVKGTGVMGFVFGDSDLSIVYTSRHFQPCAETFDDRYQFVGPSVGPRTGLAGPPGNEPQARLIYVSLGTLFNSDATFYRNCFEAFRNQNVRVIMSVGTTVSLDSLGAPPPNIVVQPHVAQLDVLQRASVFVTHGGMNSVSESLWHGVPMVVVPQMGEQEIVGSQVAELGAGLCLSKREASAEKLRECVQRLLDDDRFRQQVDHIRESFEGAGGSARGAKAILAFTRDRAPRSARDAS